MTNMILFCLLGLRQLTGMYLQSASSLKLSPNDNG